MVASQRASKRAACIQIQWLNLNWGSAATQLKISLRDTSLSEAREPHFSKNQSYVVHVVVYFIHIIVFVRTCDEMTTTAMKITNFSRKLTIPTKET